MRKVCRDTHQPAHCPNCRELIKMGKAGPYLCRRQRAVWPKCVSALCFTLLYLAATCPSHDSFAGHTQATPPLLAWPLRWSRMESIETRSFLLFRLGWVRQHEYLGACGVWWQVPPTMSIDRLGVLVVNGTFFTLAVMALLNLILAEARSQSQHS
mmetsp:Transcript_9409/g.14193  ORF Transcript_9409/g.14193 Transcript_9409/m.14193 type:complete len:155 (-) Transcript_9409:246-710(-)